LTQDRSPAESRNKLSGTVFGPSVQSGSIRDVHIHGVSARRLPVPRQLPPVPVHFTGRGAELAQLDALLDPDGPPVVVVTGTGGVGKTAVAVAWAHRVSERFPGGQLYADLGGYSGGEPVDPAEVLGRFLRALGVPPQDVPATLAEQVALYRTCTADRMLLVVADNALSPAQARVLRPASAGSRMVVTSRGRLEGIVAEGALLVEVGLLSAGESVALLARPLGAERTSGDHEALAALAELCGRLPVALRVAAGRLATRPRLSPARMVAELAEETTRLPRLSTVDGVSVAAVFDGSYGSLDPTAALLYRRLALHPGPDFDAGPAAALLTEDEEPSTALDDLTAANLLAETGTDRFRFHDLLRLHAKQTGEADDPPPVRDAARLAILEWYWLGADRADRLVTPYRRRLPYQPLARPRGLPAFSDRPQALAWLELERVNLLAAGRAAQEHGHHELAWHLSDVLWPLLLTAKHYADRVEIDERGIAAARAWSHAWAEADMHKRAGLAGTTLGHLADAEAHLETAIQLFLEADDPRGVVDAQEALAALYRESGRIEDAADLLRQTLAANRILRDDRCTGLSLISLGRVLSTMDRPDEALGVLQEATGIFGRLREVDPYNQVRADLALADAYTRLGDLVRAEGPAADAAHRMAELGSEYERAQALDLLGQIARGRGDPGQARRHFVAALDIFTALGSARAGRLRDQLAELEPG